MAITLTEKFHKTSVGTGADYTSPTFDLVANSELWIATMGSGSGAFTVETNTGSMTFSPVDFGGPTASPDFYRLHVFRGVASSAKTGITVTIDSAASSLGYDVLGFEVYNGGLPFYVVQSANYDGAAGEPVTVGTLPDAATNGNTSLLFFGVNEDGSAAHAAVSVSGWTPISVNGWTPAANFYFGINAYSKTDFTGTTVSVTEYANTPTWGMGVIAEIASGTAPAFPTVEATAETAVSTAGTSHAINLPSGFTGAAGEIAVIILDKGSTSATFNSLAGWTEVVDENLANGITVWVRDTDGTEGSTVTFTSSASTRSAAIAFRISGAQAPGAQLPELSTVATGTSTAPNATTCTPTGGSKNYLWITFFGAAGEEADDDTWVNTPPPTGYLPDPPLQKACGTAGTNLGGMIGAAYRKRAASSEDSGAFSIDVSSAWRAYTLAIHPASTAPNQGAANGTIGWVGSVTGTRTPKGAANGTIGLVGSATGKKYPAGAANGAISWVGTVVGGNLGVVIGALQWVGSVTGQKHPAGAANGSISWVGAATGQKQPQGSAIGAISWVGSVTGQKHPAGAANGSISWVGSVTGQKHPSGEVNGAVSWAGTIVGGNLGVVIGSIQWVGSVTGQKHPAGTTSGAISWDGAVEGETPTVGVNHGHADGALSWIGSVLGSRLPKGETSGAVDWTGTVVGGRLGVVLGSIQWVGAVTGQAVDIDANEGSVNGAISWVGSATGKHEKTGFVEGAITWAGSVLARVSFSRLVFLSAPGAVARKHGVVRGHRPEIVVGAKPRIMKGKDRE